MMRWMILPPGGEPTLVTVANDANTLKALQGYVGGYIERVALGDDVDLWCNEDGIAQGLEPCIFVPGVGMVLGTCVIAAHNGEGDTTGLSLIQAIRVMMALCPAVVAMETAIGDEGDAPAEPAGFSRN